MNYLAMDEDGEVIVEITDVDNMSTSDFMKRMKDWLVTNKNEEADHMEEVFGDQPFLGWNGRDEEFTDVTKSSTFDEWMTELSAWYDDMMS